MKIGGKQRQKRMYEGVVYIGNINLSVPMKNVIGIAEHDVHNTISFPLRKWNALRLVD